MWKFRRSYAAVLLLLTILVAPALQPVAAQPAGNEQQDAVVEVIDQFLNAYRTFDVPKMLSLQTDDVVWTWIDPGKNLPVFGPDGVLVGTGLEEVQAMFQLDRGALGFTGYYVFSEVHGHTLKSTEVWQNARSRQFDVPLITESTYKLRDGKIAEWTWIVSPVSSRLFVSAG